MAASVARRSTAPRIRGRPPPWRSAWPGRAPRTRPEGHSARRRSACLARYFPTMAGRRASLSSTTMIRRTIAYALWGYFGWYAAAVLLSLFGQPTTLAPLGAAVMIVVATVDWPALVRRSSGTPAPEAVESTQ